MPTPDAKTSIARLRAGEVMTLGDAYGPAMKITDPAAAQEYLEALLENRKLRFSQTGDEALQLEHANLGYYAGYYDSETRRRVLELFKASHPIIGNLNL